MGLVSSSRCNTALALGRPIVAEPHDADLIKPWDKIIQFPNTMERFYDNAMLTRAAWKSVWADQVSKFKQTLSPEVCIGLPLQKIGIVSGEGGRAAA